MPAERHAGDFFDRRLAGVSSCQPIAAAGATIAASRTWRSALRRQLMAPRGNGLDGALVSSRLSEVAAQTHRLPRGQRQRSAWKARPSAASPRFWDADVLIWAASQIVGRRRGPSAVALDTGHALRDPTLARARQVAARLPAPKGRARMCNPGVATSIPLRRPGGACRFRGSTDGGTGRRQEVRPWASS